MSKIIEMGLLKTIEFHLGNLVEQGRAIVERLDERIEQTATILDIAKEDRAASMAHQALMGRRVKDAAGEYLKARDVDRATMKMKLEREKEHSERLFKGTEELEERITCLLSANQNLHDVIAIREREIKEL